MDGYGFEEPAAQWHPTPPPDQEEALNRLRLIRSRRVGPMTFRRLMSEHGNAKDALAALPDVAAAAGVQGYEPCPEEVAKAEIKAGAMAGARLIHIGTAEYPPALEEMAEAPPVLWAMGNLDLLEKPLVAMVGARNASSVGGRMARKLAGDLGRMGYVIVSGLARGIDAAAHTAALETGTIAVQAGGIDVIYPRENGELAGKIARSGLRLAEMPPGTQPLARHFPLRNRIIAGLAHAVIVVEGAAKSGSLITARDALDLGREVLAVPGSPMDPRAAGTNMLIRDGATLVRNAQDVIEAISTPRDLAEPAPAALTPPPATRANEALSAKLLSLMTTVPVAEDVLIRESRSSAQTVSQSLLTLELAGQVERHPGGLVSVPGR